MGHISVQSCCAAKFGVLWLFLYVAFSAPSHNYPVTDDLISMAQKDARISLLIQLMKVLTLLYTVSHVLPTPVQIRTYERRPLLE